MKSKKSKNRCWDGYKPVPGKKPYSKGSCKKANETTAIEYKGKKIILEQISSETGSEVKLYIDDLLEGVFANKASALIHTSKKLTAQPSHLRKTGREYDADKSLDIRCLECDSNSKRPSDDDLSPKAMKTREAELAGIAGLYDKSEKHYSRIRVLDDLIKRDRRHLISNPPKRP